MSKLGPIPQSWYDDNRERMGAETLIAPPMPPKCLHKGYVKKTGPQTMSCSRCNAGWTDPHIDDLLKYLS